MDLYYLILVPRYTTLGKRIEALFLLKKENSRNNS